MVLIPFIAAGHYEFVDLPNFSTSPDSPQLGPVAAIYVPINAKPNYGSDRRTSVQILTEMQVKFVTLGYYKWGSCPDWWPWGFGFLLGGQNVPCSYQGHLQSLTELSGIISRLKQAEPDLVFSGGIECARVESGDTWANGTAISPLALQSMVAHDPQGNTISFPYYGGFMGDMASPAFRLYLAGWIEKQVDAGVDAVWCDQPYYYPEYLNSKFGQDLRVVSSQYAPQVALLVQAVKSHASAKGRSLLFGFHFVADDMVKENMSPAVYQTGMDFIVATLYYADFFPPYASNEDWAKVNSIVFSALGHTVPIAAIIDWSAYCAICELYLFAHTTQQQQIQLLQAVDANAKANGVMFAYLVWGGDDQLYPDKYDAVRAGTYDTMLALATQTTTKHNHVSITTSTTPIPESPNPTVSVISGFLSTTLVLIFGRKSGLFHGTRHKRADESHPE